MTPVKDETKGGHQRQRSKTRPEIDPCQMSPSSVESFKSNPEKIIHLEDNLKIEKKYKNVENLDCITSMTTIREKEGTTVTPPDTFDDSRPPTHLRRWFEGTQGLKDDASG